MKKLLIILFTIMPLYAAHCDNDINVTTTSEISNDDIIPADVLLAREPDATECATRVFADELAEQIADVPEDTPESEVATLIQAVFSHGPTLEQVIACPEIANTDEMENIKFLPIKYTFPGGREIVINYETQPKIIKQRLQLANKASMPAGDPSPRLGDLDDPSIWTNTDPAWYGIIVTEAGALRQFVGDGNNNTISLRYIEDNIDSLMPQSAQCTGNSALAGDNKNINLAVDRTTQDDQDYYVSGDVNLQWISYLEIGLDVVITVATFGGGAVISGATKAARAAKVMRNLSTGMRALAKTESVKKYVQLSQKYSKLAGKLIKRLKLTNLDKDLARAEKQLAKMTPGSKNHIAQQAKVNDLKKQVQALDDLARDPNNAAAREILEKGSKTARQSMNQVIKNGETIVDPDVQKEMKEIAKTMRNMEKTDKNVKQYQESAKAFSDLNKYRHQLQLLRRPAQRGNVFSRILDQYKRPLQYLKAANTGGAQIAKANETAIKSIKTANKTLRAEAKAAQKAAKAADTASTASKVSKMTKVFNGIKSVFGGGEKIEYARASIKGGRLRNWLFQSSMKNIGRLGRMEEAGGILYGALKFAGDMYDWSETSTGDFTSGIQFKPLLLLSADDIEGQENVVNHGMWLLWQGDTYSVSDDDAAYLQAMDFAEKFYRDLLDVQSETNDNSCNVDIYVVRPIIRNPGTDNAELYYLIMNDIPWSTAD